MHKRYLLILLLLMLILIAAAPFTPPTPVIDWWTIGPSLKTVSQGDIVLTGMVGQGVAGQVSQDSSELCSGFLCTLTEFIRSVFLPLIFK